MAILIKNVRIMQTEAPFEVKENMDVLIDNGIITSGDVKKLLEARNDEQSIILTGIQLRDDTCILADEVYTIEPVRFKVFD